MWFHDSFYLDFCLVSLNILRGKSPLSLQLYEYPKQAKVAQEPKDVKKYILCKIKSLFLPSIKPITVFKYKIPLGRNLDSFLKASPANLVLSNCKYGHKPTGQWPAWNS